MSLVILSVGLATGCQMSPRVNQHIELINAEKRSIEDALYSLQFEYEDALEKISHLETENDRLRQRLGVPSTGPAGSSGTIRPSRDPTSSGPDLRPPMIDEGGLTEPKVEIPDSPPSKSGGPARSLPPDPPSAGKASGIRPSSASPAPAWSLETGDPRITHIELNPLLTGGGNFDNHPGDDGLIVVLEPRNRDNDFVPLAGPVSVVLLDPAQEGDRARVARWDVEAKEAQSLLASSGKAKGIHLRLPWPTAAPSNSRMHVFVRYTTVDGRKLETRRELFLTLAGQSTQRWTPRSTRREGAAAVQLSAREKAEVVPGRESRDERHADAAADDASKVVPASAVDSSGPGESAPAWQPDR
jgi:hypothetical protein